MPKVEIFRDIEQRSPEWYKLRSGLICASDAKAVLAESKERRMRDSLIRRVAAEIHGEDALEAQSFQSDAMKRGVEQEPLIRADYMLAEGVELDPVAFVRHGRVGCSPDSLIVGKTRGLEIKSQRADLLIETWKNGEVPSEHVPQLQHSMMVTGYDEWDIIIAAPSKFPAFKRRVRRDNGYIARLKGEINKCFEEIDLLVRRIQGWGMV